MVYWGKVEKAVFVMISLILAITLIGCGGVRLDNPAMADVRTGQHATLNPEQPETNGNSPLSPEGTPSGPPETSPPAIERSVRLNNYNNWHFQPTNGEGRDTLFRMIADRNNIVLTESWEQNAWGQGSVTPQQIKQRNPGASVYRLYTMMCKPDWDKDWTNPGNKSEMQFPISRAIIDQNDWWLRDSNNQIAKENERIWLVDVGKPGFKEAYLEALLERNRDKGFDGFVFDYLWPRASSFIRHWNIDGLANYPTDDEWFNRAWKPFFEYVTQGLRAEGYRVFGNCAGEFGDSRSSTMWQRSLVDGVVYEQWVVDWTFNGSGWLPGHRIAERINAMASDPLEVWTADYGLRSNDPEYEQKSVAGLAMYYIALPDSPVLREKRSYNHYGNARPFWNSLWDLNIGEPAGQRVQKQGKYFWSREFTHGIVLLNYESNESITYQLNKNYRDAKGKIVSGEITVPPHTGMILSTIY